MKTNDGRTWLTLNQAAAFFGVGRRTIYHWIEQGKLTTQRVPGGGQRVLVDMRPWSDPEAVEEGARV